MQWEIFINAAKASDEMVLKSSDAAFGCIATVRAGRDELEINVLIVHELLEDLGAFVIEMLETGLQSCLRKMGVEKLVGVMNARGCAVLERLREDMIIIIIV
jgi:hypothetical protein